MEIAPALCVDVVDRHHQITPGASLHTCYFSPLDRDPCADRRRDPAPKHTHSSQRRIGALLTRGFLPWRFSNAGPVSARRQVSVKGRHPKTSYEGREVNYQIPVPVNSDL